MSAGTWTSDGSLVEWAPADGGPVRAIRWTSPRAARQAAKRLQAEGVDPRVTDVQPGRWPRGARGRGPSVVMRLTPAEAEAVRKMRARGATARAASRIPVVG